MLNTVSLIKNKDFGRVYRKSRYYVGNFIILYSLPNRLAKNRLGITASRKTGKSVRRNRIRRLIRENYRLNEASIKTGFDIVFVVRKKDMLPGFKEIEKDMKYLLRKAGLMEME
jgi:ribonuclease P protein component